MTRIQGKDFSYTIGKTYGYLVVKELLPRTRNKKGILIPAHALCYCKICGSTTAQQLNSFLTGNRMSCGCISGRSKKRAFYLKKAKEIEPVLVNENHCTESIEDNGEPWIVEKLEAKYECDFVTQRCMRSAVAHLCCCECDKRSNCFMACQNTSDKCGAKKRHKKQIRKSKDVQNSLSCCNE